MQWPNVGTLLNASDVSGAAGGCDSDDPSSLNREVKSHERAPHVGLSTFGRVAVSDLVGIAHFAALSAPQLIALPNQPQDAYPGCLRNGYHPLFWRPLIKGYSAAAIHCCLSRVTMEDQ